MRSGDGRFGGTGRLYGPAAMNRFAEARVMVAGIGGVGSWAVEALARSGVGALVLVDLDEICVSNINRQVHALEGRVGRLKGEVMAERVREISPSCEVRVVPAFVTAANADELVGAGVDAVVDAIDTLRHKAALLAACRRAGVPVVTSGAAGGRRDATRIRVADLAQSGKDPLLHSLRRMLRREHGFPACAMGEKPAPWGMEAVFSDEPVVMAGGCEGERPAVAGGIACEGGYGSVAHVTAAFGLACAGRVLERLAAG